MLSSIQFQEGDDASLDGFLRQAIHSYAQKKVGAQHKSFYFFKKDECQKVIAAIKGKQAVGSVHVDFLCVDDTYRYQGFGRALLEKIEKYAQNLGVYMITLDTMSWEAPLFYEKLGYTCEFVREGYTNGAKKYFFIKRLC